MDGSRAARSSSSAGAGAKFPAGLRVLLVEDADTCRKIVEAMLTRCLYDVTTCSRAEIALSLLRERKGEVDLVLSDVRMPDMDGFKLLQLIGLEMDLPVIMMSGDDGKESIMKGVKNGACDYLVKPVRMEALRNIWQHVVRRKKNEFMDNDLKDSEQSGIVEENEKSKNPLDDGDYASSTNEANWMNTKRRKEDNEEDGEIEHEDSSTLKKPRVVWSVELHEQFVAAVKQLGVDKAVPKKILELMAVPGLTRENVASHLQKYRLYLRKVSAPHHQGRSDTHLAGTTEVAYGVISSLDGLDIHNLAASNRLMPQSSATYQTPSRRTANVGIPITDQMNFSNYNAPTASSSVTRSPSAQEWNNKQMIFCSGSSSGIIPRQLGQPQQIVQSYGNMDAHVSQGTRIFSDPSSSSGSMFSFHGGTISGHQSNTLVMQMTQQGQRFSSSQQQNHLQMSSQPQTEGLLLNGIATQHDSRLQSAIKQQISSNGISNQMCGRNGIIVNGKLSMPASYIHTFYSPVPQCSHPKFQNSCMIESVGNCYPHASSVGSCTLTSTDISKEAASSVGSIEANGIVFNGAKDLVSSYDLMNEICQDKAQDWRLQNVNLHYDSAQDPASEESNMGFNSALTAQQGLISALNDGNSSNTCTVSKEFFSVRTEIEHGKVDCVAQHNSTIVLENSVRLKTSGIPDLSYQDMSFVETIIPNELPTLSGKQQQEEVDMIDPEFNFDGCHLDMLD